MNAKIYNGNVQPNHKEYKIWVNDEGIIKTWNGTKWIEQSGGNGESGNEDQFSYYRVNRNDDSYIPERLSSTNGFSLVKGTPSDTDSIYDGEICITIPDMITNWESITAVCASALPMKFKDKIIDYGDWKRNYAENIVTVWPKVSIEQVLYDYKFLEPITKEEFYNLENNNADNNNGPK